MPGSPWRSYGYSGSLKPASRRSMGVRPETTGPHFKDALGDATIPYSVQRAWREGQKLPYKLFSREGGALQLRKHSKVDRPSGCLIHSLLNALLAKVRGGTCNIRKRPLLRHQHWDVPHI